MERKKKAAVLGATGSVGTQALEALKNTDMEIALLTGGQNLSLLAKQICTFRPTLAAVPTKEAADRLRDMLPGSGTRILGGGNAVCEGIRECGADHFIHAISGMAGIPPALAAADTGARIAMANKEAIIAAGHLIYDRLAKSRGELIPVDSEHSAIFQCLTATGSANPHGPADPAKIRRIILTASGGPFFGKTSAELSAVTPQMALAHPTWKMGKKITIDSATLMNKGFEWIEACRLFGVRGDQVEVVVHPQSIIHSMVEYIDTSVLAQMSYPAMADCVRYALHYPQRAPFDGHSLDFAAVGTLTFHTPDEKAFPALKIARQAWEAGGCAPAALIAADEIAVDAFLSGKISFTDIPALVGETLAVCSVYPVKTEEDVYEADRAARATALAQIKR